MSENVGYLGPIASYTHQVCAELSIFAEELFDIGLADRFWIEQAAQAVFNDPSFILKPLQGFTEIFTSLTSGETKYGVIPFENSGNGSVIQTLDLLADRSSRFSDIRIKGEYYLPVHHCLMVRRESTPDTHDLDPAEDHRHGTLPGRGLGDRVRRRRRLSSLKKIYTHPQAFGQCETYLSDKLKGVERQETSSTSKAAEIVASPKEDEYSGAIASRLAAKVNDLEVLAENIEDSGDNVTRFFVFAREGTSLPEAREGTGTKSSPLAVGQKRKSKSLISFTINHGLPGALARTLELFKKHDLNLTSIDTRPTRKQPWHYIFFVECESARSQEAEEDEEKQLQALLDDLPKTAESHRFWGRWEDQMKAESGANTV